MPDLKTENLPFKPRARMLLLLGDQLIRDPAIAVFELVKNAYDADSSQAIVTMKQVDDPVTGEIIVEDSGSGMDFETVTTVWLEPGTDYRASQKEDGDRTRRYGRLPLGEKGVGRFAAHKLGRNIHLVTRKKNRPEVVVDIDWTTFEKHRYLADVPVTIREREPRRFTGSQTGTRIQITNLRGVWNRGLVRQLARSVSSICSPFKKEGDFEAKLVVREHEDWLEGLLTVNSVLEYALFRAHCQLRGSNLKYSYSFVPYPAMERTIRPRRNRATLQLTSADNKHIDLDDALVGPIEIDLYIFDRDSKILSLGVTDKKGLREFLDESGGVRVYRDGLRVYDYGERGNDWLNLGGRRVNIPTQRISNNIVIGAVSLDLEKSIDLKSNTGLIEKTNREGFVENSAFNVFRDAVFFAVTQIEEERNIDKTRIRKAYSSKKLKEPVLADLTELREKIDKRRLTKDLGPYVDRIEQDFVAIRQKFLVSASAGLSLSVVIHEVEKGVQELSRAVDHEKTTPHIKALAKHLAELIEGYGALVRRSGMSRETASKLVEQALFNIEFRLRAHKIDVTNETDEADFQVKCSRRLVVSTIINLIDNSIWWLDNKWGDVPHKKKIYVGTTKELRNGPAIVIADNGPGFSDPPEYLIEPFISRKPDGMGLGLHLADQVMRAQKGSLEFPEEGDLSLPNGFTGAVVALTFGGSKR
jgi:signal transduction histidine kinase